MNEKGNRQVCIHKGEREDEEWNTTPDCGTLSLICGEKNVSFTIPCSVPSSNIFFL